MSNINKNRKSYSIGQHGAKTREQTALSKSFNQPVSGKTHQSEHPIQAGVVARRGGVKRSRVEMEMPAYQEIYEIHRMHGGTGRGRKFRRTNSGKREEVDTGFKNAEQYREMQTSFMDQNDFSTAMQLQSLGNAFARKNVTLKTSVGNNFIRQSQADASFNNMTDFLAQSKEMAYGSGHVDVTPKDIEEVKLARQAEVTGVWPSKIDFQRANSRLKNTW